MTNRTSTAMPLVEAEARKSQNLAESDTESVSLFERLARDPSVDVTKLQALLDMHERMVASKAKAAFDTAYALMLPDIPTIEETARTDKTTYAPLEEIMETVKPVLATHGFAISFKTEWPEGTRVKVTGILTHRSGHSRTSEFLSAPDQTGSKNAIQALGSAVSYGKRYTLKDLLAIVTREEDDDAETATGRSRFQQEIPDIPQHYQDFVLDLDAKADEGLDALMKTWAVVGSKEADPATKAKAAYLVQHDKLRWERIKTKAAGVSKKKGSR